MPTPDEIYEQVLAAEIAKGTSERVATARAKAARVKAQRSGAAGAVSDSPAAAPAAEKSAAPPRPAPSQREEASPPSITGRPRGLPALDSLLANIRIPPASPGEPLGAPEDPEEVYRSVLQQQLEKGATRQVAEARASVARFKAARGIRRGPQPAPAEHPVESAPPKGHPPEPVPGGAPRGAGIHPDPGPVAEDPLLDRDVRRLEDEEERIERGGA